MTISQKIKMALAYKSMSEAELARSIGTSPSAFNQRMKTGKFSSEEMEILPKHWKQSISLALLSRTARKSDK